MEIEVRAHACPHARVWLFDLFPRAEASRYTMLGYAFDGRSANQVMKSPVDQLSQVAMSPVSVLQFIEDARVKPARAAMMKQESGFDVAAWHGIKALGYPRVSTVAPQFPRWFRFGWMPTVNTFISRNVVAVYSRPCSHGSTPSTLAPLPGAVLPPQPRRDTTLMLQRTHLIAERDALLHQLRRAPDAGPAGPAAPHS